jgi:hypothetical protein
MTILVGILLVALLLLVVRFGVVSGYQLQMLHTISAINQREINAHIYDWRWRYDAIDPDDLFRQTLLFWRRPSSFYPDWRPRA